MGMKDIEDYFNSGINKTFYMVVGDAEYKDLVESLKSRGISIVRVSEYCKNEDKIPDLDALKEKLETADVSFLNKNIVVLGLGEYLALRGNSKTKEVLSDLATCRIGGARVVLLLRCVDRQMGELAAKDKRLEESGRISFGEKRQSSIKLKFYAPEIGFKGVKGIKNVLRKLENGESGEISASTAMRFEDSLLPIQWVRKSYEALKKSIDLSRVPEQCGSEEMWDRLLRDLAECDFKIDSLFKKRGLAGFQDADFHDLLYKEEYESWLFYISLMLNAESSKNKYLGYVLKNSLGLANFKRNVMNAIIGIPHTDERFLDFYKERKRLLSGYKESELAAFVNDNRINSEESVYKLTDNALVERQEIIIWIANYGIPDNLAAIYPDLADYLASYSFSGEGLDLQLAGQLTEYFEQYKELKVRNEITEDFSKKVERLANKRVFNRLPKRDELVKQTCGKSTKLFWVDALGVEYLGYIVKLAKERGLKIAIDIGRAELPTITSQNNAFFENWPYDKVKEEKLDDIKHHDNGGFRYDKNNPYPIHLANELKTIESVVEEIATTLGARKYDKVVIASDHGSSRLAVIRNKDEKYETDTKGEHSGRCCKYFPDCDLPFAIKEKEPGYIVLADYGRFKGSRAANVEVHGGASLEEVVVPVITLSLKDSDIKISLIDKEKIKADHKAGARITLYVNKVVREAVSIAIKSKRYQCEKIDDNHFSVAIPEIKRSGTYPADIYIGNDLIEHIVIDAKGKSATMDQTFEDLF